MYRENFEVLLQWVTRAAKDVYGFRLVSLAVFGSVGRGTPRPDSDLDLLLVAEELPRGRLKRMAEFARIEEIITPRLADLKNISPSLSPIIKDKEEVLQGSLLFLDMLEDARILYDRGRFLARYLAAFREKLNRLGARRIYRGGAWYWVLKEDYRPGEVFEI